MSRREDKQPQKAQETLKAQRSPYALTQALSLLAFLLLLGTLACATDGEQVRRYSRAELQTSLQKQGDSASAGLVLGEFRLVEKNPIPDGDTIKVEGLDASLRLLAIDTEETFKTEAERAAYRRGWEQYKREMRGDSPRPVKMATPMGEEATRWAEDFFKGSPIVRLERDHPGEIRGYFGRFLVYVFANKDGEWVNYNIEAVRAGMTPYFQKYGRSRRFHEEFIQAQNEAREAQRGIWNPEKEGYDDYDERLAWWDARGDAVWAFEQEAGDQANWIALTRFDAMERLDALVGEEVVLLGGVGDITELKNGPTLVSLSRDRFTNFPLVFFNKQVFEDSDIASHRGEYISVRGKVNRYVPKKGRPQLQIIVNHPTQITAIAAELEAKRLLELEEGSSEPGGVRSFESQVTGAPGWDFQGADSRGSEDSDSRTSDSRTSDSRTSGSRASDSRASDSESSDSGSSDSNSSSRNAAGHEGTSLPAIDISVNEDGEISLDDLPAASQ